MHDISRVASAAYKDHCAITPVHLNVSISTLSKSSLKI